MITKTPHTSLALIASAVLTLAGAPISNAAPLIDYGPSAGYVSGDTSFARTAGSTGTGPFIFRRSFSDSSADPLSPTSSYSGPTFYGGYQFITSTIDQGFSRQQIRNNSGPSATDLIYLQSYNSGGWLNSDLSLAGVYLFKQEDFASGLNVGSVQLDGLAMDTTGFINADGSAGDFDGRFLVQIGNGNYYLSQTTFNLNQNSGSFSLNGTALEDELWAVYNPATSLNFDSGSSIFGSLSLTNVTAVGLYFENDAWAGTGASGTAYGLGIQSFSATGSSIPEPATTSLMIGVGGLLLLGLRRRCVPTATKADRA
ncbi:MAG: PEP-CTERM sorting domain-containing protein [Puniceicoccales bacterium]